MAYRLALATLGATCVLILLGGLVTNTGAALAVPDWPSTLGYNMVLFPWSRMVGGILYEHSHRLMGALVGVLTLALAGALWREGGRLRQLGLVAVAVVVAQGVLGGLRVVLLEDTLAIFHGCLAQAFFALLAVIALLSAPRGRVAAAPVEPALRGLAVLAAALVYAQIVFGALLTHAGRIDLHLAGAVLVFGLVPIVAAQLRRTGDPVAAPVSRLVSALLGVQLLLGIGSFLARFSPLWIPGEQLTVTALPVAHRLVGSLILGATVVLAVRASGAGAQEQPVETLGSKPGEMAAPVTDIAPRSRVASVSGHPRSKPGETLGSKPGELAAPVTDIALRSRVASVSGHPRSKPGETLGSKPGEWAAPVTDIAPRSRVASVSGHPRSKPGSRTPLQ